MPTRMLRDYTDSIPVNSLDWLGECLFIRLIQKADDFGRFHGNPTLIKSLCFPLKDGLRDSDISARIAACEEAGLLRVYEHDKKPFIEIVNFGQRLRSKTSKFPTPGAPVADICPQPADMCPPEEKGREVEGEEEVEAGMEAQKAPAPKSISPEHLELFEKWVSIWLEFHGKGKAKMPASIRDISLMDLLRIKPEYRKYSLEQAIRYQWKGIYEKHPEDENNRKGGSNGTDRATKSYDF